VEDEDTELALQLAEAILKTEPNNSLITDYKKSLSELKVLEGEVLLTVITLSFSFPKR
jgi:hypothetical protein